MADLVLDAVEDLCGYLASWSPTAWLLLAQAAADPVKGLEQARDQVRARAAMMRRLSLHTYTHTRLAQLIPDQADLAGHRASVSQALSDASLALVMSDAISQDHYHALLAVLHASIGQDTADTH